MVANAINAVNKIALDTSATHILDLNTVTYTSYMMVKANYINIPTGVTEQYSFLRTDAFAENAVRQELTLSDSGDVYVRTLSGSRWHDWKKLN